MVNLRTLQTSGKNCETTISAAYMGHHHALGILGALDIGEIHPETNLVELPLPAKNLAASNDPQREHGS